MKFISFDLETTGFKSGHDKIIEIGAVKFNDDFSIDSKFQTLVNPEIEISEDVTKINGITNEMVLDAPKIQDVLIPFSDFCKDTLLVAYNSPFDYKFLKHDFDLFKSQKPNGLILDVLTLSRKTFLGLEKYNLKSVAEHLKIDLSNIDLHRADGDALICGLVFIEIIKKKSVGFVKPDIKRLLSIQQKPELFFRKSIIRKPNQH